ncbi:MAG: hypothetical protein U9N00_04500, partial [Candidatus Bipolaricaulota bacterium]|nr:hypothetical protein [Candidatus Bipolaricaulota bacterium]
GVLPDQQERSAVSSLFLVPHGVDREAEGRLLAAPLLGSDQQGEGLVLRGVHPDLIELSPPTGKQKIGIAQVREVIRDGQFASTQAPHKVCLLPTAEALTPEAANALLKVLEEPPRGLVFLLLAEHSSDILPTLLSRSRIVRLTPPSQEDSLAKLTATGYGEEEGRYLLALTRNEEELRGFLSSRVDLAALRVQAEEKARAASPAEWVAAVTGSDPIFRHAGILVAVDRFLDGDVGLAVGGARRLARVERAKGALFLGDLLNVAFAMARWGAIYYPPYEDRSLASLCERVRPEAVLAFCRRLEERYQALERYAPPESVFLSLFLAIRRLARA